MPDRLVYSTDGGSLYRRTKILLFLFLVVGIIASVLWWPFLLILFIAGLKMLTRVV